MDAPAEVVQVAEKAAPDEVAPEESPVALPTRIVVLNDTDSPITYDRSFGPAHSLSVVSLRADERRSFVIDDEDDALTGDWIATCVCDCDAGKSCPECEPPPYETVTLGPGESSVIPWNGLLRTGSSSGCVDRIDPPVGRYVITLCRKDGGCSATEVTLPTAEPIELKLSETARVDSCDQLPPNVGPRLTRRVRWVATKMRPGPISAACPSEPRCVDVHTLEREVEANTERCQAWITPAGEHLEVVVHVPLPEGRVGGERFEQKYDPHGGRMLEAWYEQ